MTLRYHHSPRMGSWTRCVASTPDACPFKGDSHGDRTSIANEYGGGVVSVLQDGIIKEFTVTPVIEGIYGVINRDGDSRTYTLSGKLISRPEREAYLRDVILPRVRARHFARLNGEGRDSGGEAPSSAGADAPPNNRPLPIELPTSILTEAAVRPGPAGREARAVEAAGAKANAPIRGLPSKREVAKQEKEKRRGMAASLRSLFRRQEKAQRGRAVGEDGGKRREPGEELRLGLVSWFYSAFGLTPKIRE